MATLEPIRIRPESLSEIVYEAIREGIVSRRLAPGDQIAETSLAQQLNVSKTPVREALLQLEHIGLIEPDGRRGMRVVTPSRTGIRCAYEVRAGLEAQAARLVAERGQASAVQLIQDVAEECLAAAEVGDRDGFRRGDRRFHLANANATSNGALARFIQDAFDLTWTLRRRDVPGADDSLECARQHLRVVQAVRAHDADLADVAMREHVFRVQQIVLAAFDARVPDSAITSGESKPRTFA